MEHVFFKGFSDSTIAYTSHKLSTTTRLCLKSSTGFDSHCFYSAEIHLNGGMIELNATNTHRFV